VSGPVGRHQNCGVMDGKVSGAAALYSMAFKNAGFCSWSIGGLVLEVVSFYDCMHFLACYGGVELGRVMEMRDSSHQDV